MTDTPPVVARAVARVSRPRRWKGGTYTPTMAVYAFTTPANAVATARWLRRRGYKRTGFVDDLWGEDVAFQMDARKMAAQLEQAAKRARKQGTMVGFITENGGYPWRPDPIAWTNPREAFRA